jgi:hypothetical protein
MAKTTCCHPDGCARPARKLGWCEMHYQRIKATGAAGPPHKLTRWGEGAKVCKIDGCGEPGRANDLCEVHYQRVRKSGEAGPPQLLKRRSTAEQRAYTPSERHRFYKYGLTPAAFAEMLAAQGGKCYICGTSEPTAKGWSVDHCHETNVVRFIACNPCNAALGLIREDPRVAKRLYEVALECQQLRLT